MWGKIIIPMYRLWLNGLYGLYGPRCPLSSKRPINLISLSLLWLCNGNNTDIWQSDMSNNNSFIFSCNQAALWMVQSVRQSVRPQEESDNKKSLLRSQIYHGYEELSTDTNYPIWRRQKLPYMKKTRKKKQVCGAACFMAAEIKFSEDVRVSVTPFSLCSHNRIIMKFSRVGTMDRSDVHAKGQGQWSRS